MDNFKLSTAHDEVNKEYQKPELVDLNKTMETAASYGSCPGPYASTCMNGSGNTYSCDSGTGVGP